MGQMENTCNILVGKLDRTRPFGRPRRRWKFSIRLDLQEIGWEVVDWLHEPQDMDQWQVVINTVMNLRFPLKSGNFLTS
jgi:hypothetical protein